jgi:nucleotide sugar dehydrogenase
VLGLDTDATKIDLIERHISPFIDDEVTRQLAHASLDVTTDVAKLTEAKIIVVCVPTPVDKHSMPDLKPVIAACSSIAHSLVKGQLIIIESTINPGVCDDVVIPLIEKLSGMKCGRDFYLAHCPERINPGDATWNVSNIARVVGGYDSTSLRMAIEFYEDIIDGPIKAMGSLKEAEAVKIVENSFRAVNIAFVNELAMSFTKLDIDIVNVIDGAATKPFAFLPHYPGVGVGGHCIPVDPYYLIEYAKSNGFDHELLATALRINNHMPTFTIGRLEDGLAEVGMDLATAKVTVLGLSYKPNVGDLRGSPSLELISELQSRNVKLAAYDPYVKQLELVHDRHEVPQPAFFETANAMAEERMWTAIRGADAVVIATAHDEFKALDLAALADAGVQVLVDGHNCMDVANLDERAITYRGIGR